ncbi:MAG: hypothetical protein JNM78_10625 [Cyclobacteriaceae bacterium]|nr:hypothetical protein [Cyclobacteriaceae bacterium]
MKSITLVLLCLSLSTLTVAQSGWTRKKNTYFIKTAVNLFSSDNYFTPGGEKLKTNRFRQQALALYAEYGITNRLTTIVHFPILKLNSFENTNTVAGIGDLKVEVKYALFKKNIPITLSVAPEFPTGSKNNYAQSKENNFDQINVPTGDGEFNVWTTLAGSASFYPVPAYLSLSTQYNYRTKYKAFSFRDQVKFNLEFGYKLFDKVWFNGTLSAQTSVGEPAGATDFIRGEGTEFTAFGVGAAYEFIKGWSFSAQTWGYSDLIFDRKNLYSAPTFSIGVFYEIK